MGNNTVFILIGIVLGVVALAIITYFIIRWMRGSITLMLPNTAFNPGDTIKGSFELLTRKALQGNKLIVTLVGEKVTRYYENDERKTRRREVHRSEKLIEQAREYPAGYNVKHEFEIQIPAGGASTPSMDPAFAQVLSAASQLLNDRDTWYEWKIEARLDAKGVDLAKNKKISINL